jgi:3-oxoacyl-[acyl-carrier protein] reductase
MDRLKGKVVIITGGAGGIGKETSRLFVNEGASVAMFDVSQEGIDAAVAEIGGNTRGYVVDVARFDDVTKNVQQAIADFGHIDVLINAAGITRDGFLTKMDVADWDKVIAINLTGPFNCTKAVAPHMMERGSGNIINVSSVVGVYGNIGQTNYSATKAGLIGLTKTWAKEFAKKGMRVNAIAPGFIKTPMTAKMPDKVVQMVVDKTPMGRMGEPIEIANALLFLASDESSFVTGHILQVDGGVVL